MMEGEESTGEDLDNPLQQRLFDRWRDGRHLDLLAKFLESDLTHERHSGAYYLGEAVPRGETIREPVIRLADDALPYCRKAFVTYMLNTGLYDEAIAAGLTRCIMDSDFYVRLETINWAVYTTDARFDDFSLLLESGAARPESKTWGDAFMTRATRALTIARRLRADESVDEIRQCMPEEDSMTFDYFQSFERRLKRYSERRLAVSEDLLPATTGYDEYETGPLGETYDNTGRAKGELPDAVPAHITDKQLQESCDRLGESIRQRNFDHQLLSR